MNPELHKMIKTLGLPLPGAAEIRTIRALHAEWLRLARDEEAIMPLRIAEEQRAAYAAFVENPSAENRKRLMIVADENLTGKRYGLIRRGLAEARCQISGKAADILHPFFQGISLALDAELAVRRERKSTILADSNPAVRECQQAIAGLSLGSHFHAAVNRQSDESPMKLALELIPDLTADAASPEEAK